VSIQRTITRFIYGELRHGAKIISQSLGLAFLFWFINTSWSASPVS
jgi:hypothetical protein